MYLYNDLGRIILWTLLKSVTPGAFDLIDLVDYSLIGQITRKD